MSEEEKLQSAENSKAADAGEKVSVVQQLRFKQRRAQKTAHTNVCGCNKKIWSNLNQQTRVQGARFTIIHLYAQTHV